MLGVDIARDNLFVQSASVEGADNEIASEVVMSLLAHKLESSQKERS